ncbi:hypothetical protein [Natronosalvus rutilus]|uniref:Uncharacterized protein n=1 Tax=Natronosalvus rutilus TaxID=2953753 RepID=A0A9E7NEK4_9EURY|nr:hypothetical protein [Natronosalvus rutilus]UTF55564.1 hypothetical protein NGM29_19310 [Natronosalvus rutilus]
MDTIVTPTAEHLDLDAARLDPHPQNEYRLFPDGEVYVQLESVAETESALGHRRRRHLRADLA